MTRESPPEIQRTARRERRLRPSGLAIGVVVVALAALGWAFMRGPADPDRVWADAQASLKAGRPDQARAAVRTLERLRPPTPLDWLLRGQVAIAEGQTDEGLLALASVPDGHVMAPQARLLAGQAELRRHRARIAEEWFRAAVKLDPGLVQAHRERIYILGYQLRRGELNAEFEALARHSDLGFDNVFHWGLLRSAQWDPATAIEELERFLEADPEDRWSRLALAENYRRAGLGERAEALLAPLAADDPEATACRVLMLMDRHRQDEAEDLLRSVPADVPALATLRGRIALGHRDGAAAARSFRLALAGDPGNREAVFGLVNALTLLGDGSAVAPFREKARKIDELNSLMERASAPEAARQVPLLRGLGAACAALGRVAEARAWYKLALNVEPLDAESQQALYRLQDQGRPGETTGGATAARD